MKFRKKPVVIEAVQWSGNNKTDMERFIGANLACKLESDAAWKAGVAPPTFSFKIATLEGEMIASPGDWVIKGVNGEFYPCKPDIFEKTYDPVE